MKLKWYFYKNNTQVDWKVCLDIWSSTWGFSQILLENNASKIYAVDVGTSQLHDIVRADKRVISLENTDIRNLKLLPEQVDIITCDVSFIKLDMILSAIKLHIWKNTRAFLLFKPQFEVWKSHVSWKWVVKDEKFTIRELNNFLDICRANQLKIINVEKSQMKWENGNEEIFIELINK
jgi:23S rRNA (cytidine1920-2'-O)/16S rRNA (cytidine1409-2'-O)-methyltransferase